MHYFIRIVNQPGGEIQPWVTNRMLDRLVEETKLDPEQIVEAAMLGFALRWAAEKSIAGETKKR